MADRADRKRVVDGGAPAGAPAVEPSQFAAPVVPGVPATPPTAAVPASAPGTAPAGPSRSDAANPDPGGPSVKGAPVVGWTAAWAKVAVQVDPTRAREGDDGKAYVTVTGPAGTRDVVLEGLQVTLLQGESLPPETAPGLGALLHSFGAVNAVSTG
jgi:hypothetical protein